MAETIIPQKLLKKLPRTVREELPTLSADDQKKFMEIYSKRIKKLSTALLLAFVYGLNFVYLEETSTGIWFWFTAGGFGIWYIINFFQTPKMVKDFNSYVAIKAIAEVRPVDDKPHF